MADLLGLNTPWCAKEQASWQLLQPRQLPGTINMLCTLIVNSYSLWPINDFQVVALGIVEVTDGPPVAGLTDVV
jgi:uncharacterized membrane protein